MVATIATAATPLIFFICPGSLRTSVPPLAALVPRDCLAFCEGGIGSAATWVHQRETYVGTEVGGVVVEGFVDLLFTDDNADRVVVDYKTDADPAPQPWTRTAANSPCRRKP